MAVYADEDLWDNLKRKSAPRHQIHWNPYRTDEMKDLSVEEDDQKDLHILHRCIWLHKEIHD